MSARDPGELQRRVDALVDEALSDDVDLKALAPPRVDETERVDIYVLRQIGPPRGLTCIPEYLVQLISSMVLEELRLRDFLNGKDPSERITSDHRRFLADYLPRVRAGVQDELETHRRSPSSGEKA